MAPKPNEEPTRLSESILWDLYRARGEAPSLPVAEAVSQRFIARARARQVFALLRDLEREQEDCGEAADEPLYVLEVGAGSGRFGAHFVAAIGALLERFPLRGQHFRYVLSTADGEELGRWAAQPRLAALAERGALDFARYDPGRDRRVQLHLSSVEIAPASLTKPLVVFADGTLGGLRQDAFAFEDGKLYECRLLCRMGNDADLLHVEHDYETVELPYYGDSMLDDLLERSRRELRSGHLLLPFTALRAVRDLAALSRRGLLLLGAEGGGGGVSIAAGGPPPRPTVDGPSPFETSWQELGEWLEKIGGTPLGEGRPACLLGLDGDLAETRLALDEDGRSAADGVLAILEQRLGATPSFEDVLTSLRLARWDDVVFEVCRPRLLELAADLEAAQRDALGAAVQRIWTGSFDDLAGRDLAFDLASLLLTAGLHGAAASFFERSLERSGESSPALFNLALCHAAENRREEALAACDGALAADADNEAAARLRRRLETAPAEPVTAASTVEAAAADTHKGAARPRRRLETAVAEPVTAASTVEAAAADAYAGNLAHLQGELRLLNHRLARELARWRATHPPESASEELMGFRLSDLGADLTLAGLVPAEPAADGEIMTMAALCACRERRALEAGVALHLPELARRLGLDDFERATVLLALAAEIEPRYERLFGYLNDDIYRRWPSVELALRLFCSGGEERVARRRAFDPQAPLRALRLLRLVEEEVPRTLLKRGLRLEDRTVKFILGNDLPQRNDGQGVAADPLLADFVESPPSGDGLGDSREVADAAVRAEIDELAAYLARRPAPPPIVALTGPDTLLLRRVAVHLAGEGGLMVLHGTAVAAAADPIDLVVRALREVDLVGVALAVEDAAALRQQGAPARALQRLLTAPCSRPRFLLAAESWPLPEAGVSVPLLAFTVPPPDRAARQELWRRALDGLEIDVDLAELAERFRLRSAQIAGAAGRIRARLASTAGDGGDPIGRGEIYNACRSQCLVAVDGLAHQVDTVYGWDDLVVPARVKGQLKSLERWLRFRHVVYDQWGFRQRVNVGRGMATMFCGSSGTGKTMAAGIIAKALALDLYRIDLSSVISKYIGETEKNLARIFDAADAANAVLFFDEADALFGKRSEVKDSHDRYANIEVSYLLQRMEAYEGITILATNIRDNLDIAFARRLQVIVEFPFPDVADRERIWQRLLDEKVPRHKDVDISFLARQFGLAGGSIKNCAIDAALAAAADGQGVAMRHLLQAVVRELEKTRRPVVAAQFVPYENLIR